MQGLRIALATIVLVATTARVAHGFGGGAAGGACAAGRPGGGTSTTHGSVASGNGGFSLSFNPAPDGDGNLPSGQTITVTLSGGSFGGFLLRATKGTFTAGTGSQTTLSCGGFSSTITHSSSAPKTSLSFSFTSTEATTIESTVLVSYGSTWYLDTHSLTFGLSTECGAAPDCDARNRLACATGALENTCGLCKPKFFASGGNVVGDNSTCLACNSVCATCTDASAACTTCANNFFKDPGPDCVSLNRTFAASSVASDYSFSYGIEGGQVHFSMAAKTTGWVAIGISTNQQMSGSDIHYARIDSDTLTITSENLYAGSYNTPDSTGVTQRMVNVGGSYDSSTGTSSFEFTVPTSGGEITIVPGQTYYVLLAYGSGVFNKHADCSKDDSPLISSNAINFFSSDPVTFRRCNKASAESITHGILMIFAWILLAPLGIVVARYFKKAVKAGWFPLHRGTQVAAGFFTLLAFAIILAAVEFESGPHQIVGVIVFALTAVQILLGVFRNQISGFDPANPKGPDDHGPRRWIFDLLHRNLGRLLFVLGIVAVALGVVLIGADDSAVTIVIVFVALFLVFAVVLEVLRLKGNDGSYGQTTFYHFLAFFICLGLASAVTLAVIVADTPY